jgi:DNA polymerase III subunit delta
MAAAKSHPLALICGDDEFAVKQRARQIFTAMVRGTRRHGPRNHRGQRFQQRRGAAAHRKLREALQTLPFFGGGKVVWLRDCNFLGDERAASAQAVTETLAESGRGTETFSWQNVRLLISAGKVDKRKVFFKTLDKIGTVEISRRWSADDKDWADRAEVAARTRFANAKGNFRGGAGRTGQPRRAQRAAVGNEIEKLCVFAGDRGKSSWPTWRPFVRATKRRGRLRWATRWATATCRACSSGWTRSFGRRNLTRTSRRSACFTA